MSGIYEVLLEKKGRGKSFMGRPWSVRTFKLKSQTLEYWDGSKMKGTINLANSKTTSTTPDKADNKTFPFAILASDGEEILLNASCEEIRVRCIEIFNAASSNKDWTMQLHSNAPQKVPDPNLTKEEQKANQEFDDAATKAVASVFAENVERERLEREQKALEEERQKQIQESASRLLEEELANKKLREAKEAEERQREEQEREVLALLNSLGGKAKFKQALAKGHIALAKQGAATMLQGRYRCRLAKRRVAEQKAKKERLRMEAYAKKIQCRYRVRLARRKIALVKEQKRQNQLKLMAMKVQSRWRIFLARKKYQAKLNAKLNAEFHKSVSKQRLLILTQCAVRAFLARRRAHKRRMVLPSALYVNMQKLNNTSNADPVVFISGVCLNLPPSDKHKCNPHHKIHENMIKQHGKITSNYKLEHISASAPAVVNTALVTSSTSLDFILVTLMDRNNLHDGYLGQAVMRVSNIEREIEKKNDHTHSIEMTVPLRPDIILSITDKPLASNASTAAAAAAANNPSITVNITIPNPAYTMCGWLYKVSESLYSNAWKKRWFVLINNQLQYYNSELQLEASKNVVYCNEITSIKEEPHKGRNATKITFHADNIDNFWQIDWDDNNDNQHLKKVWLRKLYRSCAQLKDPTVEELKSKGLMSPTSDGTGSTEKMAPVPTAQGKTKVPVARRISVFK